MKVTLKLTLDGLMRALKARAHRAAEDIEAGRAKGSERHAARPVAVPRRPKTEATRDGRDG